MKLRGQEERIRAGEKLRELLERRGLSAESLANKMKRHEGRELPINPINPGCVEKFMKGKCHEPSTHLFLWPVMVELGLVNFRMEAKISLTKEQMETQIRDVLLPPLLPQRMPLFGERMVTSKPPLKSCLSTYNGDCAACRERIDCPSLG